MTPIAASGSKLRPDTRAMRSSASWRETQERYKTAQARSGEAHASSLPSVSPPEQMQEQKSEHTCPTRQAL